MSNKCMLIDSQFDVVVNHTVKRLTVYMHAWMLPWVREILKEKGMYASMRFCLQYARTTADGDVYDWTLRGAHKALSMQLAMHAGCLFGSHAVIPFISSSGRLHIFDVVCKSPMQ